MFWFPSGQSTQTQVAHGSLFLGNPSPHPWSCYCWLLSFRPFPRLLHSGSVPAHRLLGLGVKKKIGRFPAVRPWALQSLSLIWFFCIF